MIVLMHVYIYIYTHSHMYVGLHGICVYNYIYVVFNWWADTTELLAAMTTINRHVD